MKNGRLKKYKHLLKVLVLSVLFIAAAGCGDPGYDPFAVLNGDMSLGEAQVLKEADTDSMQFTLERTYSSPDLTPADVVFDGTSIILFGGDNNQFYSIDPGSGAVVDSFGIDDFEIMPYSWISRHGKYILIDNKYYTAYYFTWGEMDGKSIIKIIDPMSKSVQESVTLKGYIDSWTFDGTNYWILTGGGTTIKKLSYPQAHELVVFSWQLEDKAVTIGSDGEKLYITTNEDKIFTISQTDGRITGAYDFPMASISGVNYQGGFMWACSNTSDKLYKISITTVE